MNINTIAQYADHMNASESNKAAIYSAFRQAIDNNGQFSEIDMARLYKYFSPNVQAKPKTDDKWVAQAMADKYDPRYYLKYIYSDGSRIMATNGHRIHAVNKSIEIGFYDKNMNRIEVDAKFPDIDRIIPKNYTKSIKFSELELVDREYKGKTMPAYVFDGINIDAKYLKQAAQYFDDAVISYADKNSPILITDEHKLAVVMTMRS